MTEPSIVDVVIPVYNRPERVLEAVASVFESTHPVRRIIVVDDGSTDDTPAVVDHLAATHDDVTALHRPNGGPAAARNTGIAASDAPWVAFADSDDLMVPDRLEWQLAHLAENPDTVGVCGLEILEVAEGVTPPVLVQEGIDRGFPGLSFPSLLTPRAILEDLGGFAEDLRIGEDFDLFQRMLTGGMHVEVVRRPAVVRRIFGDNLTYEHPDQSQMMLKLIRRRVTEHHGRNS